MICKWCERGDEPKMDSLGYWIHDNGDVYVPCKERDRAWGEADTRREMNENIRGK